MKLMPSSSLGIVTLTALIGRGTGELGDDGQVVSGSLLLTSNTPDCQKREPAKSRREIVN